MWYVKLAANGINIEKWYLDPFQAYPKDRENLKKVQTCPEGKRKNDCQFISNKKTVKNKDNKNIEIDGEVEERK